MQQLVDQNPTDPVLKALSASPQRRSGKIREALVLLESGLASYEAFPERLYLLWKTYDDQLGNHQKGRRSSAACSRSTRSTTGPLASATPTR